MTLPLSAFFVTMERTRVNQIRSVWQQGYSYGKKKGLAACIAQTTCPFARLDYLCQKQLSDFLGSFHCTARRFDVFRIHPLIGTAICVI